MEGIHGNLQVMIIRDTVWPGESNPEYYRKGIFTGVRQPGQTAVVAETIRVLIIGNAQIQTGVASRQAVIGNTGSQAESIGNQVKERADINGHGGHGRMPDSLLDVINLDAHGKSIGQFAAIADAQGNVGYRIALTGAEGLFNGAHIDFTGI